MNEGKESAYKRAISDGLHEALKETWNIPEKDRFQIFHDTKPENLQIDKEMWDVERTDDVIVFHVFTSPRTSDMKLALYERLPQLLQEKAGLRPEDVFISCASNNRDDWSFGNGKAQLLEVDAMMAQPTPAAAAASPNVLGTARAAPNVAASSGLGGGRAPLAASAGARRSLTSFAASQARTVGAGGPVISKLGLVAACGASALFGTLASQRFGHCDDSSSRSSALM